MRPEQSGKLSLVRFLRGNKKPADTFLDSIAPLTNEKFQKKIGVKVE